jgi:hypothetical protein
MRVSFRQKLLRQLMANKRLGLGTWGWELARITPHYSQRITDLRDGGLQIMATRVQRNRSLWWSRFELLTPLSKIDNVRCGLKIKKGR